MREVGKRINSFGVIFKKIKPVKDLVKSVFKIKQKRKRFKRDYAFGAEEAYLRLYAST